MDTQKLQAGAIRVQRALGVGGHPPFDFHSILFKIDSMRDLFLIFLVFLPLGCATLPDPSHKAYSFPKDEAFYGDIKRPYKTMGLVRSKVNFQSLDFTHEENDLCRNYFNKAVLDLVKLAKKQGGDAVIDVKSVVFLEDGRREMYSSPECSDDGLEGQVLCQGIVVKWTR